MQAVPISWARVKYHAVHTFVIVGDDGVRRHVRFAWRPVAGVCPLDDPLTAATDFLSTEMRQRLSVAPARFELKMTISDEEDAFDDPTMAWPVTRRAVMMGSLYLNRVADDQIDQCERLSYNPMRLTAGSKPPVTRSFGPVGEVHEFGRRGAGSMGCPVQPRHRRRCADRAGWSDGSNVCSCATGRRRERPAVAEGRRPTPDNRATT